MPTATKSYSQEELLRSIQKKDKAAFGMLYDTYSAVLFGVICKSNPDLKFCEEILQQSFVKIWQNISNYDPSKQRLLAWMLVITRGVANDILFAQNGNKNEEIQTLTNNVSNNKEVLTLIYFKGYSLKKASEILSISIDELKIKLKSELDQIRGTQLK